EVQRVWLQDDLVLVIVLQAVGVFAIAPVLRTARGLHIGSIPRARTERTKRRRGMERTCANLHVIGLKDHAALLGPVIVQGKDQTLERAGRMHMGGVLGVHASSPACSAAACSSYCPAADASSSEANERRQGLSPCRSLAGLFGVRHL